MEKNECICNRRQPSGQHAGRIVRTSIVVAVMVFILGGCSNLLGFGGDNGGGSGTGGNSGSGTGSITGMSPPDGTSTTDTTPTLSWDAVDGAASYEVQIAESEAGVVDATAVEVTSAEYTPASALTNNATHWWRVRAVDADGQGTAWSTTTSLTVSWGAMTNLSPADGTTVADTTPTLSWDAVSGAANYEVQIADSEAGVAGATVNTVTDPEYTPASYLTNNSTHYWRVRAVDADGQVTAWSAAQSLLVSWGTISGMSPADGTSTTDTTPTLSWDAVSGEVNYEVQIADTQAGVAGAPVNTTSGTSHTIAEALSPGDTRYWRVRAKDGDGQYGAWSGIIYLQRPYIVGDEGPAGGIVFYDKGSVSDGWRYLEAAPVDIIDVSGDYIHIHVWGESGTPVGGTGTAIGTGADNTDAIVSAYHNKTGNYAARLADQYEYGGYDDWFLPSKDELNQMYDNKGDIGGFASDYYWSSSEYDSSSAWGQAFNSGGQDYYGYKYFRLRVRAIRAF